MDKKYKEVTITFPSVFRIRAYQKNLKQWLAVWIHDEIPQSCICSSEEEGWKIIDFYQTRYENETDDD